MKRYLTGGLALLLALTLLFTACGGPGTNAAQSGSQSSQEELVSLPTAEPEEESSSREEPPSSEPSAPALVPMPDPAPESSEAEPPESPSSSEPAEESASSQSTPPEVMPDVAEDGWYNTKDEVAEYIYLYNRLPGNYKTKKEAQAAGWSGGGVEKYTGEGTAIGGDSFGNREGLLPKAKGRTYTECDIDTVGKSSRGAKRIIFSNDGLVYYTEDHYNTFELLYGEE